MNEYYDGIELSIPAVRPLSIVAPPPPPQPLPTPSLRQSLKCSDSPATADAASSVGTAGTTARSSGTSNTTTAIVSYASGIACSSNSTASTTTTTNSANGESFVDNKKYGSSVGRSDGSDACVVDGGADVGNSGFSVGNGRSAGINNNNNGSTNDLRGVPSPPTENASKQRNTISTTTTSTTTAANISAAAADQNRDGTATVAAGKITPEEGQNGGCRQVVAAANGVKGAAVSEAGAVVAGASEAPAPVVAATVASQKADVRDLESGKGMR